jgi:hypothetical protein
VAIGCYGVAERSSQGSRWRLSKARLAVNTQGYAFDSPVIVVKAARSHRDPSVVPSPKQNRGAYRRGTGCCTGWEEPLLEWGDDVNGIAAGTFRWRSGAFGGVKADCTECRSTGLGWAGESGAWMRGAGRS